MDILSFIKSFSKFNNVEILDSEENFSSVQLSAIIKDFATPDKVTFFKNIGLLIDRLYDCSLNIKFYESHNSIDRYKSFQFNEYLNEDDLYNYTNELKENVKINISIDKSQVPKDNGVFRIFLLDTFFNTISKLSIPFILKDSIFAKLSCKNSIKSFQFIIDEDYDFNTNLFYFSNTFNSDISIIREAPSVRQNFNLSSKTLDFKCLNTPLDFALEKKPISETVNLFFKKMSEIISIIYISNYSEINDNILKNVIQGYKNIEIKTDFTYNQVDTDILIEIYKWIYSDAKFEEKIHLARNIITLDYKDSINDINNKTLSSIQSNFKIYSKNNVERYIQLKNQITEHILNLSMKSLDIVNEFSSNFKNAFLANISFIFTIVILNIISDPGNTKNIFNKELSILYISVVIVSLCYLIISKYITDKDIKHYDNTFDHLKNLYIGLLSPEDLDETFDNAILNSDKEYIGKKICTYSLFWLITLVISILCLYLLSDWTQETTYKILKIIIEKPIQAFKTKTT